ncbi:YgjV family protein [Vibrio sp. SM6]|uniref:YgjV family protein n=1 Tax=Vibrio agarilyticus TaxID=2726741 RepID=A0A7X8YHB2_9VIBR|nr:YgjV family protein [Vibrio agarilyticus]NLS13405.1 YgjV family protein [Vibrio agarilyticus]
MEFHLVDYIGYAASILVALSLTMKHIIKLRVINFIGCTLFTIYGVMIDSWPVALTNGFIACVNVVYLTAMYREFRKNGRSKFDE